MNEQQQVTPQPDLKPKAKMKRGLGSIYKKLICKDKTHQHTDDCYSRIFWVQYYFRGKKFRESSQSTVRADAVKLLRRRLEEMGRGRLVGKDAEKVTFEDMATMLINDYKTNNRKSTSTAERSVYHLKQFFGLSRAIDITTDRIRAYIRSRQEADYENATIQKELAALKRMFNLAIQAERLDRKPHIPSVKVQNARTGFFEGDDLKVVLSHLPEDIKPVVEFAYLTGWRKSEVLSLQWRQVDFEAGTVRLDPGTTKNDEGRIFPFSVLPPLADVLKRQHERTQQVEKATGRIIPWVFHRNGRPIRDFRDAWDQACESAGLQDKILHDFRRTAVRNLERAGVPRSVAMKLTGHKTESVYRRYAIVPESDLAEGVKKLATLHEAIAKTPRPLLTMKARTGTFRAPQRHHQADEAKEGESVEACN